MLEIGLVKLIEMRRVAPIEKILERLAKLENALDGYRNIAATTAETIFSAADAPGKKNLKVDFPLEEVPFPVKEEAEFGKAVQDTAVETHRRRSEHGVRAGIRRAPNFRKQPNRLRSGRAAKTIPSNEETIDFPVYAEPEPDFSARLSRSKISTSPLIFRPKPAVEQDSTSREFIESMPVKMPPISSEELEHIEDNKLDDGL